MADATPAPAAPAAASPKAAAAPPAPASATPASTSPATPTPAPATATATAPVTPAPKSAKPAYFVHKDDLFQTVCRPFMNRKCTRGGACKSVHDKQLCSYFYRTGECKFGAECRKNHFVTVSDKKPAAADTPAAAALDASGDAPATAKKSKKPAKDQKSDDKKPVKGEQAKPKKKNESSTNTTTNDSAAAAKSKDASGAAAAPSSAKPKDASDKKTKAKKPKVHRTKKNTECFDPMTAPVDLRVTYDLGTVKDKFSTSLTTRDVLLAPNLFSDFKKGELYAKLVAEIETCGVPPERLLKLWHGNATIEGTHLIADDKTSWKRACPTFHLVIDRVTQFFKLSVQATRFNWYKDTSQWKPFHFDAAAVKPEIAAKQNFTVGISFGATRDAAFEHAETKTVVSIPQPDGCVYAFARDTNVLWRHGILQDTPVRDEGRISIIAWGWIDGMVDPAQEADAIVTAVSATS